MAYDVSTMVEHFVEDVELNYSCSRLGVLPPGQWRGRDALRAHLRRVDVDYEPLDAEILTVLVEGDDTVVRWLGSWRHRATGQIHRMDLAHFLRWRNGLVSKMHEFRDHRCETRGADRVPESLDDILNPRGPGLSRDEMARRLVAMSSFSCGPDVALFRDLCSPDVVCEFVGDRASIAHAGRHRGVEALISIVRSIGMEFEQLGHVSRDGLIVDGGNAAARRTVEWRHRGTGRRGQVQLADFVRFEDGRIVEIIEFHDSMALLQMRA
ncbi:MAG: nuclear transport factor 2 family protein [Methylocystis sp.]|uniref:nuclear transport factor 2 family protein n=1 Tax=Methylocystis sp. TaxID=1911079 RepID=UPI003D120C6A